jgi:hypothetical protein
MDSIRAIDKKIAQLQELKRTILELLPDAKSEKRTITHLGYWQTARVDKADPTRPAPRAKRVLSKDARARIAAAQKIRWAKWKKAKAA